MKKTVIILAVILTSGLTALSTTKNENKSQNHKVVIDKNLGANTDHMATAD